MFKLLGSVKVDIINNLIIYYVFFKKCIALNTLQNNVKNYQLLFLIVKNITNSLIGCYYM